MTTGQRKISAKQLRVWLCVMLLCFIGQLVFSSATAAGLLDCGATDTLAIESLGHDTHSEIANQTSDDLPSCHGAVADEMKALSEAQNFLIAEPDCCGEDCNMAGCEAIIALVNHIELSPSQGLPQLFAASLEQAPQTTATDLFRPPSVS